MLTIPRTSRKYNFTPLRYPGGKTSLSDFFDLLLKSNGISNAKYIEPYAGGAGAALNLLMLERVRSIVINDLDRSVYAFWKCVTDHSDELIERIATTPVTIEVWRRQFQVFRESDPSLVDLGFATFFLNRTNRSGILTGGPIGGLHQNGEWKLDARFNRRRLIEKIRLVSSYRDRISVTNKDGLDILSEYRNHSNAFFYIDPPYFEKGSSLYLNAYNYADHKRLAEMLTSMRSANWILSYDNVDAIRAFYEPAFRCFTFSIHYQAHSSREGSELMVISDPLAVPTRARFS